MRSLREAKDFAIIVTCDEKDQQRAAEGLRIGASDVIQTPLDLQELQARVATQVRRKRYIQILRKRVDTGLELSVIDQLTGLYNRRYMLERLQLWMQRSAVDGKPVSVVAFDIDHFKKVNDVHAASSEEARYTHASCEGADAVCGVIVVASAGSFTLDWTAVNAHTAQPDNAHADCPGLDKKLTRNVPAGNYDTYVVPASCSYKLKLKILSGNSKDKNLFLTPGCQIIAKVSGTASSNNWKTLEISTLSSQIPTNSDGKPIDGLGQKCGKLSGSGF